MTGFHINCSGNTNSNYMCNEYNICSFIPHCILMESIYLNFMQYT